MYVFYRYDLLPFQSDESNINQYGIIDEQESQTHEDGVKDCDCWWEEPGVLYPFLIEVDRVPVGFIMVASGRNAHPKVNYRLNEFFILNKYRKKGIGDKAVSLLFEKLPGVWELGWLEANIVAEKFWKKIAHANADNFKSWKYYEGKDSKGKEVYIPGLFFEIKEKRITKGCT